MTAEPNLEPRWRASQLERDHLVGPVTARSWALDQITAESGQVPTVERLVYVTDELVDQAVLVQAMHDADVADIKAAWRSGVTVRQYRADAEQALADYERGMGWVS